MDWLCELRSMLRGLLDISPGWILPAGLEPSHPYFLQASDLAVARLAGFERKVTAESGS